MAAKCSSVAQFQGKEETPDELVVYKVGRGHSKFQKPTAFLAFLCVHTCSVMWYDAFLSFEAIRSAGREASTSGRMYGKTQ